MKLSTFIYVASLLHGLNEVTLLLACFAFIGTVVAFGIFIEVNYAPPKGGELLVLPSTPSLA